MVHIQARLFGDFAIFHQGQLVPGLDSTRIQSLFAYLLLHHDAPHLRQRLAVLLWPDSKETQSRTNLRTLLNRITRAWPAAHHLLTIESKRVGWRPGVQIELDAAVFETCLNQAQACSDPRLALVLLQKAVELYQGDLLPNCYDEWILPERARLHHLYLRAIEATSDLYEQQKQYPEAVLHCRQLIHLDPLSESHYRRLMRLHMLNGDRAAALRVYTECAGLLERELNTVPDAATQAAYRQLRSSGPNEPAPFLPDARFDTPLIGRNAAWEQLLATGHQLSAGQRLPTVLVISGDAGVGKTTLAMKYVAWMKRKGFTTVSAACFAPEADLAFTPVVSWLRGLQLDSLDEVWRGEVARLMPDLSPQNGQRARFGKDLDAQSEPWQKRRFYEAMARAILCQPQPVCLHLEDIQWSDSETLAWLHFLLRLDHRAKLLLLATLRPGESGGTNAVQAMLSAWRQQGRLVEIDLQPLDLVESAALAEQLTGEELTGESALALYQHTEGNPLFIVETIRSLQNVPGTAQARASKTLTVNQQIKEKASSPAFLPPTVQMVLRERLEQLSTPAQQLLSAASVIGRSFTLEILLSAAGIHADDVVLGIDELWRRRIIREQDSDGYDFSHEAIRQVMYAGLSPARRRWLHGKVAQALAETTVQGDQSRAARLAFHYQASGQAQKAFACHLEASAAAQSVYAYEEALKHLNAALVLVDRSGQVEDPSAGLYEQMGDIFVMTGRSSEARQAYQQASESQNSQENVGRAEWMIKIACTWLAQYQLEQAGEMYEQALALCGDPAGFNAKQWQVWLEARLGQLEVLYYSGGLDEMAGLAGQIGMAVTQYGSLKQRSRYFQARVQMGSRKTRFRHTPEIMADSREALRLAQESGDGGLIQRSRFGLGFALLWGGDTDAAMIELTAAIEASQASGNIPVLDRSLAYLTIARRLKGQVEAVRDLLPKAQAAAETEENDLYLGVAHANLAWYCWQTGSLDEAGQQARAALHLWRNLRFPFQWLARWPLLAAYEARDHLGETVEQAKGILSPEQHQPVDEIAALLSAALNHPQDDQQKVLALLREALKLAAK